MGDVADFRNFMAAVIDRSSFDNIEGLYRRREEEPGCPDYRRRRVPGRGGLFRGADGGGSEGSEVPHDVRGNLSDRSSASIPTTIIASRRRSNFAIRRLPTRLPAPSSRGRGPRCIPRASSSPIARSNFYINNKPTGAVVGQQPFGGARGSGTNDKAGSLFNLMRWVSLRTVSETFAPPLSYRYPFMDEGSLMRERSGAGWDWFLQPSSFFRLRVHGRAEEEAVSITSPTAAKGIEGFFLTELNDYGGKRGRRDEELRNRAVEGGDGRSVRQSEDHVEPLRRLAGENLRQGHSDSHAGER